MSEFEKTIARLREAGAVLTYDPLAEGEQIVGELQETRRLTREQIAATFGVPAHMLRGDNEPLAVPENRRQEYDLLEATGRLRPVQLSDGTETKVVEQVCSVLAYDAKTRQVTVRASDETINRMGDVVAADGWRLANYMKNPVVLVDHEYRVQAIVGKVVSYKIKDGVLYLTIQVDSPNDNRRAEMVVARLKSGSLRAVSVGFIPLDWEKIRDEDDEWTGGFRFTEQELLEISWVAVPANPNALVDNTAEKASAFARLHKVFKLAQWRKFFE